MYPKNSRLIQNESLVSFEANNDADICNTITLEVRVSSSNTGHDVFFETTDTKGGLVSVVYKGQSKLEI